MTEALLCYPSPTTRIPAKSATPPARPLTSRPFRPHHPPPHHPHIHNSGHFGHSSCLPTLFRLAIPAISATPPSCQPRHSPQFRPFRPLRNLPRSRGAGVPPTIPMRHRRSLSGHVGHSPRLHLPHSHIPAKSAIPFARPPLRDFSPQPALRRQVTAANVHRRPAPAGHRPDLAHHIHSPAKLATPLICPTLPPRHYLLSTLSPLSVVSVAKSLLSSVTSVSSVVASSLLCVLCVLCG